MPYTLLPDFALWSVWRHFFLLSLKTNCIHTTITNHSTYNLICYCSKMDINVRDKEGLTPLHIACGENLPKIVRVLMDKGAGLTVLNCFCQLKIQHNL